MTFELYFFFVIAALIFVNVLMTRAQCKPPAFWIVNIIMLIFFGLVSDKIRGL